MNLWQTFDINRKTEYKNQGISFHYQKGLDIDIKKQFLSFSAWLRKNYIFPVHINIYILNCETIQLRNWHIAYGSFRWFPDRNPIIRIPAAINFELLTEYTKEEIIKSILSSLVHELSHYYQWVLDSGQQNSVSERQANYFRFRIIDQYIDANK